MSASSTNLSASSTNLSANLTDRHSRPPVTNWLHPRVYEILIAITAWFVLAVWNFAGPGIVDYLLFIVSGFIFVAVALPLILSRVGRDGRTEARDKKAPSLRDWASWNYDTGAGPLGGAEAATQILLPIAAAAVGMTIIGLLFQIIERVAA